VESGEGLWSRVAVDKAWRHSAEGAAGDGAQSAGRVVQAYRQGSLCASWGRRSSRPVRPQGCRTRDPLGGGPAFALTAGAAFRPSGTGGPGDRGWETD